MKKYFIFKITAVAKTEIDRGGDFFYNTYKTKEGGQAMKEPEKNPGFALEENLKKALTELMVLFLLSQKECYIGELTAAIKKRSRDVLTVVFPYGAVYRLEQAGYIRELEKRTAPDGRRRQYLGITEAGKIHLKQLLDTYRRFTQGINDVLEGDDWDEE